MTIEEQIAVLNKEKQENQVMIDWLIADNANNEVLIEGYTRVINETEGYIRDNNDKIAILINDNLVLDSIITDLGVN